MRSEPLVAAKKVDVGAGPVPARTPVRAFLRRSPSTHIGPCGPSGWHWACPYTAVLKRQG